MLFEVDVCITTIVIDIVLAFAMCFIMGSTHNRSSQQKEIYLRSTAAEHISISIC